MKNWRWIAADFVYAIHDRQLAEHGGLDGIRDQGAVESALARPRHLDANGRPDCAALAATYAYGLARNYGFADGNKRTAWIVLRVFMADNGFTFRFEVLDAIRMMESVSGGTVDEESFAAWIRERIGGEE